MIMPFLYRYPFRSVCSRGLASSFEDKNLFFVWTSTHDQYLSGGNVTCQTVTCYSEFVSALSVGLVSLCPSPSGLNYFDMAAMKCHNSLQFSAPPRETSSATKSEEKRMFSQASAWVVCCRHQFLYLVIWDVSRLIPCQVTTRESKGTQSKGTSIFTSPHPPIPCHHASWKSPKISFSSISPYSHNISFSPSSLHFRPDFSLLPIVYLAPLCLSGPSLQ